MITFIVLGAITVVLTAVTYAAIMSTDGDRVVATLFAVIVLAFGGLLLSGLGCWINAMASGFWPGYAEGVREGYLTKVSVKGVIWKTNEAQIQVGTGSMAALQEPFAFSVPPDLKDEADAHLGDHVRVTYSQWLILPYRLGETNYLATSIEPITDDDTPSERQEGP